MRIEINENNLEFLVSLDTIIKPVVMLPTGIFLVLEGLPPFLVGVEVVCEAIFVNVLVSITLLVGTPFKVVVWIIEVIGSLDIELEGSFDIDLEVVIGRVVESLGTGNVISDGNGSI